MLRHVVAPAAIVAVFASVAAACPNCKEALAEGAAEGRSLAAGFYYSILFMVSMPFLILGTFGTMAYRSVQRAKAEAVSGEGASADSPQSPADLS